MSLQFSNNLLLEHIGRVILYMMRGLSKSAQARASQERVQLSSPQLAAKAKVWITGLQWTHSSSLAILIGPELPVVPLLQKLPPFFSCMEG